MGSCGSKAEAGVVAPTEVVSSKQGAPTRMKAAAAAAAEPPALPEAAAAGGYREQAGAIENQIVTGTPAVEPANDVIDWKAALEQVRFFLPNAFARNALARSLRSPTKVGDDEEFLRELLGDLVDELKTGVEVLEKAISEGDIVVSKLRLYRLLYAPLPA
jgi:hypothetical protein